MTIVHIPLLNQSGIYLLSRDKKVSILLEDFLVVTFHSPSSSSTALILQGPSEHRKDFLDQLERIHEKYSSLTDVDANLIQCKIFGAADKFSAVLSALRGWLKKNHIPVIASDLGRALPGELIVEGPTGRVGIQYKKGNWDKVESLLTTGTARNRMQEEVPSYNVLILSKSRVIKTLAKQSIEEETQWSASYLENLDDTNLSKSLAKNLWSAIVVSDEVKTENKIMDQLVKYREAHPLVPIAWIGAELPPWKKEIGQLRLLPPLEPFLIPHFKKILKQSVLEASLSETSEMLSFSKRKKVSP